jgi:predicted phosphohydrolase
MQYISDIHLEFYKEIDFTTIVKPVAPYLALAGDIGYPNDPLFNEFIDYVSKNWKKVFYVPGNHEYYNKKPYNKWKYSEPSIMSEIDSKLEEIFETFPNVYLLSQGSSSCYLEEENIAIVGLTLWSSIPIEIEHDVLCKVNDFRMIATEKDKSLSVSFVNNLHEKQKEELNQEINYWNEKEISVCVITHYMPSYILISPKYIGDKYNCCFASNSDILMRKPVKAWIYGHTHDVTQKYVKHGIFTAVNAMGYKHENILGFDTTAVIEIDTRYIKEDIKEDENEIKVDEIDFM